MIKYLGKNNSFFYKRDDGNAYGGYVLSGTNPVDIGAA